MTLEIRADPVPLRQAERGQVRITGTRIPLEAVLGRYLDGETPEDIIEALETLSLADVHAVIAYYWRHREEVDTYLRESAEIAEAIRREHLRRYPQDGLREALLKARLQHAQASE